MSEYRISEVGGGVGFNIYNVRSDGWKFVRKADTYAAACQLITQWRDRSNDWQCGCSPESYEINRQVVEAIVAERQRQIDEHGISDNHSHHEWIGLFAEEVGETQKDVNKWYWNGVPDTAIRAELIQSIATWIAWLEKGLWE